MNKGIVLNFLCQNPSCSYSEEMLKIKQPVNIVKASGNCSFKIPTSCPKCKTEIELINFVSGSIEIEADEINIKE
ncbi:MAG: hypothetical protein ACTSRG_23910 [Candidatus Helarchaeota archaeon]